MKVAGSCITLTTCLVAALLLAGGIKGAAAQSIELIVSPDKRFTMDEPKGYCRFDPNGHEADRKYLALLARSHLPENRLLAAFADCGAVNALRAAPQGGAVQSMERWVEILLPLAGKEAQPINSSRADVIDMFAKLLASDSSVSLSHAIRVLEQARPGTAEPKQVGLLARDDLALISGLLAREDEDGKIRLLAGAAGMTLVGNYAVSVNSYRTFVKRDTYDALVAEVREIVRGLIKHNETQAGR